MATGYSDLEVWHGPEVTAPIPVQEEKIAVYDNIHYRKSLYDVSQARKPSHHDSGKKSARSICTLWGVNFTRTRICLLVLLIIAVAGGAGGGVAVGLVVSRNSRSKDSSSSGDIVSPSTSSALSSSITASPTSTTQGPVKLTTTLEVVSPKQTLYRDCPSANNTVYNALGSSAYQFRKICGRSFKQPPSNVVNQNTASLNDCIDLCVAYNINNKTEIAGGYSSPCNSVCWRNSPDDPDFPGQCFGSTIFNSTDGFQTKEEIICDSGAWINQNIA